MTLVERHLQIKIKRNTLVRSWVNLIRRKQKHVNKATPFTPVQGKTLRKAETCAQNAAYSYFSMNSRKINQVNQQIEDFFDILLNVDFSVERSYCYLKYVDVYIDSMTVDLSKVSRFISKLEFRCSTDMLRKHIILDSSQQVSDWTFLVEGKLYWDCFGKKKKKNLTVFEWKTKPNIVNKHSLVNFQVKRDREF